MNLRALRSIVAIADHGSFAAASEVVHLSQSALSTQMKQMEDSLGRELFNRSRRPPSLNAYGLAIVEKARKILFLYRQMFELLEKDGELSGTMTLGVIPTWTTGILPRALTILRQEHPTFGVHIVQALSGDLYIKLERGEIDAAIIAEPSDRRENLAWHRLAEEPFMLVAPLNTLGENYADILRAEPYIRYTRNAWAGQRIETALITQGIVVNAVMELDTLEAINAMVREGLGVSIVPRRTGVDFANDLQWIPFGRSPISRQVGLLERIPNPRNRMVATLMEVLHRSISMNGDRWQGSVGIPEIVESDQITSSDLSLISP